MQKIGLLAGLCLLLLTSACSSLAGSYYEQHELRRLTVVFLDENGLQQKYAFLSGAQPVRFSGMMSGGSVNTVRGFYDSTTNTIYCPKMDFEVCGHELHHAVLGRFHSEP
jgi:hypothetical protein